MNEIKKATHTNTASQIYEIVVVGHLDATWSEWFDEMTVSYDSNNQTCIAGPILDQTALIGLLLKAHHLGLHLVRVNRVEARN